MLGTCIAFYIVISSLLVEVFADIIQSEPTLDSREELRRQFCLFLGFFIVLPLGLLRNMSSIGKFWSNATQKRHPLKRYQKIIFWYRERRRRFWVAFPRNFLYLTFFAFSFFRIFLFWFLCHFYCCRHLSVSFEWFIQLWMDPWNRSFHSKELALSLRSH